MRIAVALALALGATAWTALLAPSEAQAHAPARIERPSDAARSADPSDTAQSAAQAELDRVRDDPALANDPAALAKLAADANAFPAGLARSHARLIVGVAWLRRFHKADAGRALLREVADDPLADPMAARFAEHEVVTTLVAEGRIDEAERELGARGDRIDPETAALVRQRERRGMLRAIACAGLAAFAGGALVALLRAAKRGAFAAALADAGRALRAVAPVTLVFGAFLAAAGGMLASQYEAGRAGPFLLLGAAVTPLALVARAWGAIGVDAAAARIGRALLCGGAVLAAAFLILDRFDPSYLDGFGL